MLVVHPHCVSGGGGGSAAMGLASPSYISPYHTGVYTFNTTAPQKAFSLAHGGDVAEIRLSSVDVGPSTNVMAAYDSTRAGGGAGSGIMFGHYDRTSFLSPRQERARPAGPDFRGLYHNRRVGLVSPPVASTPVQMQLDKFPIWGQLRRSQTDLRSSLPTNKEIASANEEIVFFAHRRGYTRQQGSTSYLSKSRHKLDLQPAGSAQPLIAGSSSELGHRHHVETPSTGLHNDGSIKDVRPTPIKTSTPKNAYASSTGRDSSAKSTKSNKSTRSSVAGDGAVAGGGLPGLSSVDHSISCAESVAARSEKIAQLKANMMPDVVFSADGQIESGLYPTTFKQSVGAIDNDRKNEVFVNFGGLNWKSNANKPVIYSNLFLPRVTCPPKSIGVRYRTELDLVKAGKLTP